MRRFLIFFVLLSGILVLKAEIPDRPVPPRLVNDFAGILKPREAAQLENKLVRFANETSTQIVVTIVNDLDGYDPGDYAFRVGEKWGVGQQGKDNGLIILIKPRTGNDMGRIFIATGYGLEGVLPDAIVNGTIIDTEMIPHFRQNNYFNGIDNGTDVIMDIVRGEYTAEHYRDNYAQEGGGILPVLIILLFLFIILPILRGRSRRAYSPGKSLPFWLALGLMSGGRHSGSFGNFSSGRGSFGGGGGGFGGFGGGSFGGGGAGGSW